MLGVVRLIIRTQPPETNTNEAFSQGKRAVKTRPRDEVLVLSLSLSLYHGRIQLSKQIGSDRIVSNRIFLIPFHGLVDVAYTATCAHAQGIR